MVKFTNSNPNSKRKGVKKETMPYITVFSDINTHSLTAMRFIWGSIKIAILTL